MKYYYWVSYPVMECLKQTGAVFKLVLEASKLQWQH